MNFIQQHINSVHDLCKKHKVKELYAFGSVLDQTKFNDESDVDLIVKFNDDVLVEDYADLYFDLADELELIFTHFHEYVILIDDFEVNGQPNYGWDKGFTSADDNRLANIKSLICKYSVAIFFPLGSPDLETGAKRGSVILCSENLAIKLDAMGDCLQRYRF